MKQFSQALRNHTKYITEPIRFARLAEMGDKLPHWGLHYPEFYCTIILK